MLGNTLVLPLSTGNVTLIKVNQDDFTSVYRFGDATQKYQVKIRHTVVNPVGTTPAKDRHNVEFVHTIYAAGAVAEYERKFYFVFEHLPSDTSIVLADAVADLVIATANAFLISLVAWES